ncbi:peptide-methionine (R)-S-oxide reductase MsrB [Pontibacter qinzhouensis]|uniref:peptide-methionine (R)-S-oxide reductase n=1 Tax=Pontibacter qinzhouensis TaxID=2603253 RepID=A0A5C8KC93_9BACT|nr:peptide-methionine (R)-S-oxide reductase MsrB [Pontibacter qinzhouensis]TXK49101.1 peptide-methionine (R)-S-oxide reductase MsrB [Pontibacter qinzhouensis]
MNQCISLMLLSVLALLCCQSPTADVQQVQTKEPEARLTSVSNQQQKNPYYSRTDTTKLVLPDSTWRRVLPADVYQIARKKGTERAFTGKYWNHTGLGTYYCGACGNALFRSDAKFASDCGWPSFFEVLRKNGVTYQEDRSHGMIRVEVLCGRCDGHLGHLFDDGPPPTGKRYCMNSVVLDFEQGL